MGSDWTAQSRTGLAMLREEDSAGVVDWRRAETALLAVKRLSRGGIFAVVLAPVQLSRRGRLIGLFWEVCGRV